MTTDRIAVALEGLIGYGKDDLPFLASSIYRDALSYALSKWPELMEPGHDLSVLDDLARFAVDAAQAFARAVDAGAE